MTHNGRNKRKGIISYSTKLTWNIGWEWCWGGAPWCWNPELGPVWDGPNWWWYGLGCCWAKWEPPECIGCCCCNWVEEAGMSRWWNGGCWDVGWWGAREGAFWTWEDCGWDKEVAAGFRCPWRWGCEKRGCDGALLVAVTEVGGGGIGIDIDCCCCIGCFLIGACGCIVAAGSPPWTDDTGAWTFGFARIDWRDCWGCGATRGSTFGT